MRTVVPLLLILFASLPSGAARPNILFLLVDDLRYDTFGFAGHKICRTAAIVELENYLIEIQTRRYEYALHKAFCC